jgi:hypothetical protein
MHNQNMPTDSPWLLVGCHPRGWPGTRCQHEMQNDKRHVMNPARDQSWTEIRWSDRALKNNTAGDGHAPWMKPSEHLPCFTECPPAASGAIALGLRFKPLFARSNHTAAVCFFSQHTTRHALNKGPGGVSAQRVHRARWQVRFPVTTLRTTHH